MAEQKPSFLRSVVKGIGGYIKGALAGGAVGIITGLIVGAIAGLLLPAVGGIAAGATAGAIFTGSAFASIGAIAGTVTDVVKSREVGQPSAQDVVGVAKATFAQGIAVGQQLSQQQAQGQTTTWRDRELARRAAAQQSQQLH